MKIDLKDFIPQLQSPECIVNDNLPPSFWRWENALLQSGWGEHILPNDNKLLNVMLTAHKLQLIQQCYPFNKIRPVSWLRCLLYNEQIRGAKNSSHIDGLAVDFVVEGVPAYKVRERLSTELERLDIRMERLKENDGWCHVDLREPGPGGRYFKP